VNEITGFGCVPGHPLVDVGDSQGVRDMLQADLLHDRLNQLFSIFWLVSTPNSSHIASLHHQIVRGKEIVITENPGLHLLWFDKTIYIKPLPPYLTNHAFWNHFLSGSNEHSEELRRSALGYLRTYYYLIQHQSDFDIAVEKKLIRGQNDFTKVLYFLQSSRSIQDQDVTPRYRYGELRLRRLNFWGKIYRFQFSYHDTNLHYGSYFALLVAPIAFIFATVSVALSAMQVALTVQQLGGPSFLTWGRFDSVSQWFSVVCLVICLFCLIVFPILIFFFLLRELVYALTMGRRSRPKQTDHAPYLNA
jgi:hypothetical protein